MSKVSLCDKQVFNEFKGYASLLFGFIGAVVIFVDIPANQKIAAGLVCIAVLIIAYLWLWYRANTLREINLTIEGSTVIIKTGDIFKQEGLKAIAFNEYFDTQVDERIIAGSSLNGKFINEHLSGNVSELDEYINNYRFDVEEKKEFNAERNEGKKQKFEIGTICVYGDYILTALSKFDEHNVAHLTMPEYLGFLISFWDKVNRVYAQKSVSVPIFGSGLTRIKGHKTIDEQDLLKIMLWTFRISEMRFKHPAKLTIIIHDGKIDKVNLLELKTARNGL
ncbi:macro domain-containing protein [Klebsiella michiganensis]|uniref:macro domain-containing protein n=1 Tax=Klebsiella michiganensis TaxID=1134687 RepID=UPI00351A04C3